MTDGRLRIGTAEREAAMRALDEHLADGRLDIDEYGERSARAASAITAGELAALFTDLPAPHPPLPGTPPPGTSRPGTPPHPALPASGPAPEPPARPGWRSPWVLVPAALIMLMVVARIPGAFLWVMILPVIIALHHQRYRR